MRRREAEVLVAPAQRPGAVFSGATNVMSKATGIIVPDPCAGRPP